MAPRTTTRARPRRQDRTEASARQPFAPWAGLPLAAKLGSALATLGVVVIVIVVVASAQLARLDRAAQQISRNSLVKTSAITAVQRAALSTVADVLRHGSATGAPDKAAMDAVIAADDASFDQAWAAYTRGRYAATAEEVATLTKTWKRYRAMRDGAMLEASRAGRADVFFAIDQSQAKPFVVVSLGTIDNMVEAERVAGANAAADAATAYRTSRLVLGILAAAGILVGTATAVLAVRSVLRPVRRVTDALRAVSAGDLTQTVTVTSRDEVGRMSADLNGTVRSIADIVRRISATARDAERMSAHLADVSAGIDERARTTLERADAVALTAAEVAASAGAAAAGAEQMTSSIQEIASSAAEAVRVGGEAVASAEETHVRVKDLGASSQQIGDILTLISSIAEQTNLLALNATIEAARAGDSGRGFAVVATEVKALAQQTASATGDIDARVSSIQDETSAAVTSISGISEVVANVNRHQTTIAGAVEEQTSVTSDIARSVTEAASGAASIADTIGAVAQAARQTSTTADDARETAGALAALSAELTGLVSRFRV